MITFSEKNIEVMGIVGYDAENKIKRGENANEE